MDRLYIGIGALTVLLIVAIVSVLRRKAERDAIPSVVIEPVRSDFVPPPRIAAKTEADDEGEIAAVISAAVACFLANENAIEKAEELTSEPKPKPILTNQKNQKAWQRVSREEQIYTRL